MDTTSKEVFDNQVHQLFETLRTLSATHGYQLVASISRQIDAENSDVITMLDIDSSRGLVPDHFRAAADILMEKPPGEMSDIDAMALSLMGGKNLQAKLSAFLAEAIEKGAPDCECAACTAMRADKTIQPRSGTRH